MSLAAWCKPIVEKSPRLSRFYRALRDSLKEREPAVLTPHGFKFGGNESMTKGEFEPEETELVKGLFRDIKFDAFINAGANVGFYCCYALARNIKTFAFEPLEANLRQLYENVRANNWSDIEVFPIALGDHTGLIPLYGAGTGASLVAGWAGIAQSYQQIVPINRLDFVLNQRLGNARCLFLIDVEGAEYHVVKGADCFLKMTPRPYWIVEICFSRNQPEGVAVNPVAVKTFELFLDHGYECWTIERSPRCVRRENLPLFVAERSVGEHPDNYLFCEEGGYRTIER